MSIRGKNLFRALSADPMELPIVPRGRTWAKRERNDEPINHIKDKTGRSEGLIDARNEHLLCRLIYWGMTDEYKYEWIIKQLCREFYITERTVGHIIESNSDMLQRLRKVKNLKAWREKFPFFKW